MVVFAVTGFLVVVFLTTGLLAILSFLMTESVLPPDFRAAIESRDLRRLALFLWMKCFLAALSRAEKVADNSVVRSDFLPAMAKRKPLTRFLISCFISKFSP